MQCEGVVGRQSISVVLNTHCQTKVAMCGVGITSIGRNVTQSGCFTVPHCVEPSLSVSLQSGTRVIQDGSWISRMSACEVWSSVVRCRPLPAMFTNIMRTVLSIIGMGYSGRR
jgi:hypothetical protein